MQSDFQIIIDLILSATLAGTAIWMFILIGGYEGFIGKSLKTIAWGGLLMGIAHLIEVFGSYLIHDVYLMMLTHRLLATISFVIIAIGFRMFIKR